MGRPFAVLVFPFLLLAACADDSADNALTPVARRRPTVLSALHRSSYKPPRDGRLTDEQVQKYVKVREKEKEIVRSTKADKKSVADIVSSASSAPDAATTEIRAAKELGYDTQEYLWVRQQILAASTSEMAAEVTQDMNEQLDSSYAEMKRAHQNAKDDETRKMYAEMIANYEKSKTEMEQHAGQADPALEYNRQLLAKYEGALSAWNTEMTRYEKKKAEADHEAAELKRQKKSSGKNR